LVTSKFKNKHLRDVSLILIIIWVLNCVWYSEAHSKWPVNVSNFISASSNSSENRATTSQVYLQLPETSLCDALAQLERKSGIVFKCPERLGDHVIYARTLKGPNWTSVAHELLEGYSIIEFWNNKGGLSKIYLLGSKEQYLSTPIKTTSKSTSRTTSKFTPSQNNHTWVTPGLPGSDLNRSQLFALLKTSTFKPFPQHFFKNPDYQEILDFAGIKTPRDWLVVGKSRTLKKHIQKLLKK
jgi:hypothetical protein